MYNLTIHNKDVDIDLQFKQPITVVSGDSSTGKSFLVHIIQTEKELHPHRYNIRLISDLDDLKMSAGYDGDLAIIDRPEQYADTDTIRSFLGSCPSTVHHLIFLRSNIYVPTTLLSAGKIIWERAGDKLACRLSYGFGDVL